MHIWQAIKMACKSLWTNKLRSALTMLGIIIGVMTVALLTSVASSVKTAIVSEIRTQSTLSIVMCTSRDMTYKKVDDVLKGNQHKPSDDDYYKYSMIYSSNAVVSEDLTGIEDGMFDENFLRFNHIIVTEEEYNKMTQSEKTIYDSMKASLERPAPSRSSVMAVTKNFNDVYELSFDGKFPETADEILVDDAFVECYLGEDVSASEAINQVVTMGIKYHTDLTFKFLMPVDDNVVLAVSTYMNNIGFEVNDSKYSGNELVVSIDYFTFSNEFVIDRLVNGAQYTNPETGETTTIVPPYKAALVAENPVIVNNIYDTTNSKEYKIVGVLKEDNTSMFSTMSTGNESEGFSIFEVLMNSVKGSCYMLIDETNLKPLGEEETDLNKVPMSFAYLRFKNEDVMDGRVNDVTAAFMSQQMLMYGKDFMIISMSAVASVIDSVMNTLTIMLTVISIVSLIIGGIGIMNIMLVAVTERTREIGIRKAIGAKRGSILTQFLVEALMLSLLGGAIGLTISGIGCAIIGHFIGFRIIMPLWVIGMSVGFCSFIGLAFGMFPAIKASHMQPIDALRRD